MGKINYTSAEPDQSRAPAAENAKAMKKVMKNHDAAARTIGQQASGVASAAQPEPGLV
jgi:hypothetical protein